MSGDSIQRPKSLTNRNFLLLWQGQLVSQIGTQAFVVGMMFWMKQATGSASIVGTLMMFSLLPGVLLGPFGGTVADRYSRRTIIILSDIISGLAVLGVAFLFFRYPTSKELLIFSLFSVALLSGIVQAFFRPAILAAIPDLVPEPKVPAANSMTHFAHNFSAVLGQATGGLFYSILGAGRLFFFDGLTFLFSAVSEFFIKIPQHPTEKGLSLGQTEKAFRRDLIEGLRFVWTWKGMRNFLVMVGLVNFFAMPFMVLMPFYAELNLRAGAEWYGFLMAGFSAGSVAGYVVAGLLPVQGSRRSVLIPFLLSAAGLLYGSLGFVTVRWLALLITLAAGVLLGVFNVLVMTIFQTTTPREFRGRIMGLVMTISMAASPLGTLAGGIAGDLTGKNIPVIYAVCGGLIFLSVLLIGSSRSVFRYLAQGEGQRAEQRAD